MTGNQRNLTEEGRWRVSGNSLGTPQERLGTWVKVSEPPLGRPGRATEGTASEDWVNMGDQKVGI